MKRLLLAIAIASMFLLGLGVSAWAYPRGGVLGRAEYHGYFTNAEDHDKRGKEVLPSNYNNNGRMESLPGHINSVTEFVNFIRGELNDTRGERTGASFIVHSMLGTPGGERYRPPRSGQLAVWEDKLRALERAGRITWRYNYSFTINSYYTAPSYTSGSPDDVAFFDESGTASSIVFRDSSGSIFYAIKWECANPVGNVRPIPDDFNISGHTVVSDRTVVPNQSITFRHYVRNNGPDSTAPTNIWWVALNSQTGASTGGPANSGTYSVNQEKNVYNENVIVPGSATPGQQICRRVGWDPVNNLGGRNGRGAPDCATVIHDYSLTPQVQVSSNLATPGQTVTFEYEVVNGGPTISQNVDCKIVGANRPPGYTPLGPQDADRSSSPPGYPVPPAGCPRTFNLGTTDLTSEAVTIGNEPVGSLICRSLVVNPRAASGGFRSSAEVCVRIGKKPYVHFMGNDVWAGGNFPDINPACSGDSDISASSVGLADGSFAGSLGEYGVFGIGRVTGFGSMGWPNNGDGSIAAPFKRMIFANTEPELGQLDAPQHCINDYLAQFASTAVTGEPGLINVGGRGSGVWRMNGDHTFTGVIPNGTTQVFIVQDGSVTIDQQLRYSGNYGSLAEIPSLVIIATCTVPANCNNSASAQGHIRVNDNVAQMDGLFVAKNTFNTCANQPDPLHSGVCNTQLIINGAVIARQTELRRTFGAEGGSPGERKRPAEVFNFVPEMYLRSALSTGGGQKVETTITRELPPRF